MGRWHTRCFIIDVSQRGGEEVAAVPLSVLRFPSILWDRAWTRLFYRASRKEGCAHPAACVGRKQREEGGGKRGKLRLTVNFVVPHVTGVVRNFEASGLTFRSAGKSRPPSSNRSIASTRRVMRRGKGMGIFGIKLMLRVVARMCGMHGLDARRGSI